MMASMYTEVNTKNNYSEAQEKWGVFAVRPLFMIEGALPG